MIAQAQQIDHDSRLRMRAERAYTRETRRQLLRETSRAVHSALIARALLPDVETELAELTATDLRRQASLASTLAHASGVQGFHAVGVRAVAAARRLETASPPPAAPRAGVIELAERFATCRVRATLKEAA